MNDLRWGYRLMLVVDILLSQIDDGFEVAYNKSFVAIQSGDWEAAEELLLTAERETGADALCWMSSAHPVLTYFWSVGLNGRLVPRYLCC